MTTIPETIMEEARKNLDRIAKELLRKVDAMPSQGNSFIIADELARAEKRGADREIERVMNFTKTIAAGFAVKAQNPSKSDAERRLLSIHSDTFLEFAQTIAAIRSTSEG